MDYCVKNRHSFAPYLLLCHLENLPRKPELLLWREVLVILFSFAVAYKIALRRSINPGNAVKIAVFKFFAKRKAYLFAPRHAMITDAEIA